MARFKISMKLQGLDLQIEGSREDIPIITQNLGAQLSGLLGPAGAIIEGNTLESKVTPNPPPIDINSLDVVRRKGVKRRRTAATDGSSGKGDAGATGGAAVLDFKVDPSKYGAPNQSWSTAQKAMWLIYVFGEEGSRKELSVPDIMRLYQQHFREAGAVYKANLYRDLRKQKTAKTVGEDATKEPSQWYLHDAGRVAVQALIQANK